MLDYPSLFRSAVFAVIFAGVEAKYVIKDIVEWRPEGTGQLERPVFGFFLPYHLFYLLPMFIAVSFALPVTAWAGNTFAVALVEDVFYFAWQGRWVRKGDWTTRHFGSFQLAGLTFPVWWVIDILIVLGLFLLPF